MRNRLNKTFQFVDDVHKGNLDVNRSDKFWFVSHHAWIKGLYNLLAPDRYEWSHDFNNASINRFFLWIPEINGRPAVELAVMIKGKMIADPFNGEKDHPKMAGEIVKSCEKQTFEYFRNGFFSPENQFKAFVNEKKGKTFLAKVGIKNYQNDTRAIQEVQKVFTNMTTISKAPNKPENCIRDFSNSTLIPEQKVTNKIGLALDVNNSIPLRQALQNMFRKNVFSAWWWLYGGNRKDKMRADTHDTRVVGHGPALSLQGTEPNSGADQRRMERRLREISKCDEFYLNLRTGGCIGLLICILSMIAWYALKTYRRRQRVNALVARFRDILIKERMGGFKPLDKNEAAYYV